MFIPVDSFEVVQLLLNDRDVNVGKQIPIKQGNELRGPAMKCYDFLSKGEQTMYDDDGLV